MKRLALLLLAVTLPANAATLIINGVPVNGTVVITTGAAPPAPTPTPTATPTPTPPPIGCSGGPDQIWEPFTTTWLYPIPGATFSGDRGLATKIRANGSLYPKGITITVIDQSPIAVSKELVISSCPHDYTVKGYNRRAGNSGMIFYVYFYNAALGHTTPGPYDVVIPDGQDFYINAREQATPRTSTVTVQFSAGVH